MTPPLDSAPEMDGLPVPQRWLAIAAVLTATTMSVLDASITNVALPTIARTLKVDAASAIWVVNAYQLAIAACVIALAGLSDMVGYRRIYQVGLTIFTVASLACALSTSLTALVAARVVQGIGAAGLMSVGPALLRTIYPSRRLGTALAMSALTVASSATAGPMVGGMILGVLSWPWLFALNLPLGVFGLVMGTLNLPRTAAAGGRFDIPGAILAALAMGCFVVAVDGLSKDYPPALLGLLWAVSLAALACFIPWQRVAYHPVLPPKLFHSRRFTLAAITSSCSFIAQGLAFVTLPFLFQGNYGFSPFLSGLLFTPWPLTIIVAAPVAGHLSDRHGARIVSTVGLLLLAVGLASLGALASFGGEHAGIGDIIWRAAICGLGFGFFQSPNNRELLGTAPRSLAGAASGVLATARTFGQSVGAAIAAVVVAAPQLPGLGAPLAHVPIGRIAATLWLACAAATAALAVSALRTRAPAAAGQAADSGKDGQPAGTDKTGGLE